MSANATYGLLFFRIMYSKVREGAKQCTFLCCVRYSREKKGRREGGEGQVNSIIAFWLALPFLSPFCALGWRRRRRTRWPKSGLEVTVEKRTLLHYDFKTMKHSFTSIN